MTQIKTFRYKVSSPCIDNNMHLKKLNMHDEYVALYTPERIDAEINLFCKDKEIIDIKINSYCQSNTTDNGTNINILQYTIIYKEEIENAE